MFLLDFACTRFIENMEKSLDITAFSLSLLIGNICTGSISNEITYIISHIHSFFKHIMTFSECVY